MSKIEFLTALREQISGLPTNELEERLLFYNEMLDDSIEEGLTEEEAVAKIGSVDDIARQIIAESTPVAKAVKDESTPKQKRSVGVLVLLVLGSPIWLSLAISAFAVVLSLYATLWAVVVSLWAVNLSLAVCAPCGALLCIIYLFTGHGVTGLAMLGLGVLCAGLAIFLFFACKGASYATVFCSKKIFIGMKKLFMKKEEAK